MDSIVIDSDSALSSSDEEAVDKMYTGWKDDLAACLDSIDTVGDFAASKTYPSFVNPGIEVAGAPIPLPLTSHDAQTLRAACKQAPYGKGEETLVDESVRKT